MGEPQGCQRCGVPGLGVDDWILTEDFVGHERCRFSAPTKADQRRLADLRAGNMTREKALGAQGVALNEQAMVALQTRALIRLFVGDDPARQLAYDIAYQEAVAEGLGEVEADLRRRKLTGGLIVPNGAVPRG